jgi:hypothetical protein
MKISIFKYRLALVTFAASVALAGCFNTAEVKYPQANSGFEPKRTYDATADKVWKAAVDALDSNRVTVLSADQASGRIQTDTLAGPNFISIVGGGTMYRYSFNLRITREESGKTKLFIVCKLESMHQIQNSTRPFMDVSPENQATVTGLENWLYEQIEKGL